MFFLSISKVKNRFFIVLLSLMLITAFDAGANNVPVKSDIPSVEQPVKQSASKKGGDSSPGLSFWLFVVFLALWPIAIFAYLFKLIFKGKKPKSRHRKKIASRQQERNDSQTDLQMASKSDESCD